MIGIGRFVVLLFMTFVALLGRILVHTLLMALPAVHHHVTSHQWKVCIIVIDAGTFLAHGVTIQAIDALIDVPAYHLMLLSRLFLFMTGNAGEHGIIHRIRMAIHTFIPFIFVGSRINGKELGIMIEVCRRPCRLRVALLTFGGEPCCLMYRIGRRVVFVPVTIHTQLRVIHIIPIMAFGTIGRNVSVCTVEFIKIIVHLEGRRSPSRIRRVATCTIGR